MTFKLSAGEAEAGTSTDPDELYDEAVAMVRKHNRASISFIQRHLRLRYNRSARLVEQMELNGVVTPAKGDGTREVIGPVPESCTNPGDQQ